MRWKNVKRLRRTEYFIRKTNPKHYDKKGRSRAAAETTARYTPVVKRTTPPPSTTGRRRRPNIILLRPRRHSSARVSRRIKAKKINEKVLKRYYESTLSRGGRRMRRMTHCGALSASRTRTLLYNMNTPQLLTNIFVTQRDDKKRLKLYKLRVSV